MAFVISEPDISVEIPKNQSFVDGFWIHWKLYNFEDVPPGYISIEVRAGDQIWEIRNPLNLSEYIELSITQERTEVNVTIAIRNVWTKTKTLVVITEQPTGVYKMKYWGVIFPGVSSIGSRKGGAMGLHLILGVLHRILVFTIEIFFSVRVYMCVHVRIFMHVYT